MTDIRINRTAISAMASMSPAQMANTSWFPTKFFSGCDVDFVFLNPGGDNNVVTGYVEQDIMSFNMAIRQMTEPIFGYNSFLWDRFAKGNIMAMGTIAIAYTFKQKIMDKLRVAANPNIVLGGQQKTDFERAADTRAAEAKEFQRMSVNGNSHPLWEARE